MLAILGIVDLRLFAEELSDSMRAPTVVQKRLKKQSNEAIHHGSDIVKHETNMRPAFALPTYRESSLALQQSRHFGGLHVSLFDDT